MLMNDVFTLDSSFKSLTKDSEQTWQTSMFYSTNQYVLLMQIF